MDLRENINKISDLCCHRLVDRKNGDVRTTGMHYTKLDNRKIDLTPENS